MALNRYVLTATVTVPAGTPAADANGFGLETFSGPSGAWAAGFPQTFQAGQVIVLDPAGALYAAIGAGNLKPYTAAQETGGSLGVSN